MAFGLMLWVLSLAHAPAIPHWGIEQRIATYHLETIDSQAGHLLQRFTPGQLAVLQKLNRADLNHLDRLPAIVVPNVWLDDELSYSPLPDRYPSGARHRRVIVVYQPGQVFGAYEHGTLVRWGPVSTGGRMNPTPPGEFNLNWRARRHISTVNPEWVMDWSFNFDNQLGLALHQQELPGTPASHGCVRLLEQDARWLFEWADPWILAAGGATLIQQGTPVFIVGEYAFDTAAPWQSLDWLATRVELPSMVIAEGSTP